MDDQTFVPALLELQSSSPETVVKYFHNLFSEIAKMNPQQVIAAFQTVQLIAESRGLEQDLAVRHTLSSLHQRMVTLVFEARISDKRDLAISFCSLLKIKLDYLHESPDFLVKHQIQ
jgi:hypothetical protein